MPTCLRYGQLTAGVAAVNVSNADGTKSQAFALVQDTSAGAVSGCSLVAISGAEYVALQSGSGGTGTVVTPNYPAWNELGSLSIADAQAISAYVGLLWAGVWGIRQVIKSLSIFERNHDE